MSAESRQSPRMPNTGIVKHLYMFVFPDNIHSSLECDIIDISPQGIKGQLKEPGDFRYNIEQGFIFPVSIIFNNDKELKLKARVAWYKDHSNFLEFGLHFTGSIW